MTREELKEHCKKEIEMCEFLTTGKGEKPSGKVYEEHKLILELLEQEPCIQEKQANADKIDAVYIDGFKAGYSQARFDLEQEPCEDEELDFVQPHKKIEVNLVPLEDAISRQAVEEIINDIRDCISVNGYWAILERMKKLPSVSTEKTGRCKDCKHFVYDEFAIVNGIPIIVAHEICMRWSGGCKTKEDGYCHMFEPKTQEVEE